jgi:hypothetical protein
VEQSTSAATRAGRPCCGRPGRAGSILELLDDVLEIDRASAGVFGWVEELTGMRIGALQALLAISQGADHPRAVALRTGQVDAATTATVETLVQRGLVHRHHHPCAPPNTSDPTLLHLTETGTVAVQQAQGIQIRLIEALALALGREHTSELSAGIKALANVMDADGSETTPTPGADNVIFVVGAQVPPPDAARERIFQHSLKLEDARALAAYGQNSSVGKILEIHQEQPGRIHIVLIHQTVGS